MISGVGFAQVDVLAYRATIYNYVFKLMKVPCQVVMLVGIRQWESKTILRVSVHIKDIMCP